MRLRQVVRFLPPLGLALLAYGSAAASAQTAKDPITVVKAFVDATNAGQLDKIMSLCADDVLEVSPEGRFQGKEAARLYFKTLIDRSFRWEATNYRESKGEVRFDYKWFVGPTLVGAGNDGLVIVKNGKIVFDGLEKDRPK
jgi:hypothetical protein